MLLLYIAAVFTSLDGQKPLNLKKQIIFYCYYRFFYSAIPHERFHFHFAKCLTNSWISKRMEKMDFGLRVCVCVWFACTMHIKRNQTRQCSRLTAVVKEIFRLQTTTIRFDWHRPKWTWTEWQTITRLEEKKKAREHSNDVLWVFLTRRRHHYFIARHDSAARKRMKPKNF